MLGDDKGMEVVAKLVAAQATVFAKASLDPISRQAAREAAMEAVTGSYVSPTPAPLLLSLPACSSRAFACLCLLITTIDMLSPHCTSNTAYSCF